MLASRNKTRPEVAIPPVDPPVPPVGGVHGPEGLKKAVMVVLLVSGTTSSCARARPLDQDAKTKRVSSTHTLCSTERRWRNPLSEVNVRGKALLGSVSKVMAILDPWLVWSVIVLHEQVNYINYG